MAHLLIVDDEQSICWGLARLGERLGHSVATAPSAEGAFEAVTQKRPDAILLDVRLPGMTGIEAMPRLRDSVGAAPIVVMTAYGDLETAVHAVRAGAFEYLVKPFDLRVAERVILQALAHRPADAKNKAFTVDQERPAAQAGIVGQSAAMQAVFRQIAVAAPSHVCVNLVGESGTGKELVARAIHQYSNRAGGPFIPVHIAALNPTLAESELFGHVRGAFTGADERRCGMFELAHGGTLFLDEVADIPLSTQVKLLRALEYGEIWPLGADRPVMVDLRIISATHQDLHQRVGKGEFRHDLLYRLMSFQIRLPPLRERREDIEDLSRHFLTQLAARSQITPPPLADETLDELRRRPWHGNVRELRNALEHASLLAGRAAIQPNHVPPPMPAPPASGQSNVDELSSLVRHWTEARLQQSGESERLYDQLLSIIEPPLLHTVLDHCRGQAAAAARLLGLHRMTLRKKLDQLDVPHDPE